MFEAYFDDSGTHSDARASVAAGFMASKRNWARFEALWRKAWPHSKPFHAEKFFGGPQESIAVLDGLLDAITHSDIRPIVSGVDVEAFWRRTEPERRYLTGGHWSGGKRLTWTVITGSPNTPFMVPFHHVVLRAVRSVKLPGAKVHFWFDRNGTLYGYMKELYGKWRTHQGEAAFSKRFVEKMGNFDAGNIKDFPAMQAADLFAFTAYHVALNRFHGIRVTSPGIQRSIERFARIESRMLTSMLNERKMLHQLTELPTEVRTGQVGR